VVMDSAQQAHSQQDNNFLNVAICHIADLREQLDSLILKPDNRVDVLMLDHAIEIDLLAQSWYTHARQHARRKKIRTNDTFKALEWIARIALETSDLHDAIVDAVIDLLYRIRKSLDTLSHTLIY